MKVKLWQTSVDTRYVFRCPACNVDHCFVTKADKQPIWDFNGNVDKPTFRPSLLYNVDRTNPTRHLCHSFVTDGQIQFLSDCSHAMAGKTVELNDIDA